MNTSTIRLLLYAIISSVEMDMRNTVIQFVPAGTDVKEIMPQDVIEKCVERLKRDTSLKDDVPDYEILLQYSDFNDISAIISNCTKYIPEDIVKYLKGVTPDLGRLAPIRNRVMHSRPLLFNDYQISTDTAEKLISSRDFWITLDDVIRKIKSDPGFIIGTEIPTYELHNERIYHNLPIPDFDETGFIGRESLVKELVKHCNGPYPVITLVGEGGIGKTALALKVAYDLLDTSNTLFDIIIWVTSKTLKLTANDIIRIDNAISSSLGILKEVALTLGADTDTEKVFGEVIEYLQNFKILLIIDNLETVIDPRIKELFEKLPIGSKILVTSRIGIGAYEFPVKLGSMTGSESIQLLRASANLRKTSTLVKTSNDQLGKYCKRMKYNPGYIKWFVSAVQTGRRPEEVLANPDIFLDDCLSNVHNYLSPNSKTILSSMQCVSGQLSQAEMAFINNIETIELQRSLHQLLSTNMVIMNSVPVGSSYETTYELSELAREYLAKHHPIPTRTFEQFKKKKNQLMSAKEKLKGDLRVNPYSVNSISMPSKGNVIIAISLKQALDAVRKKDFTQASGLIDKAKKLAPEYYEVHRCEGFIKDSEGNYSAAKNAYEAALELEPKSAPLRYWYGGFLLRSLDDTDGALYQFQEALKLDSNSIEIAIEIARVSMYVYAFKDAERIFTGIDIDAVSSEWVIRKYYDLYLQFFHRKGEMLLEQKDFQNALYCYEEMVKLYNKIPHKFIDNQTKHRILKSKQSIKQLRISLSAYMSDEMLTARCTYIQTWISDFETCVQTEPRYEKKGSTIDIVESINHYGNFGFIKTRENGKLFFHKGSLEDPSKWMSIRKKDKVTYEIGQNPKGPMAINLKVIE